MLTVKTLTRLRGCTGWFESSMGAYIERYVFLSCGLNNCVGRAKMGHYINGQGGPYQSVREARMRNMLISFAIQLQITRYFSLHETVWRLHFFFFFFFWSIYDQMCSHVYRQLSRDFKVHNSIRDTFPYKTPCPLHFSFQFSMLSKYYFTSWGSVSFRGIFWSTSFLSLLGRFHLISIGQCPGGGEIFAISIRLWWIGENYNTYVACVSIPTRQHDNIANEFPIKH